MNRVIVINCALAVVVALLLLFCGMRPRCETPEAAPASVEVPPPVCREVITGEKATLAGAYVLSAARHLANGDLKSFYPLLKIQDRRIFPVYQKMFRDFKADSMEILLVTRVADSSTDAFSVYLRATAGQGSGTYQFVLHPDAKKGFTIFNAFPSQQFR